MYLEVIQLLLDGGADVNAKDGNGQTALMREIPKDAGYFIWKVSLILLLVEKGADVNERDSTGTTLLSYARWAVGRATSNTERDNAGAVVEILSRAGATE